MYKFQCNRCFITSGRISRNREDAPTCCGGEPMTAIAIQEHNTAIAKSADELLAEALASKHNRGD